MKKKQLTFGGPDAGSAIMPFAAKKFCLEFCSLGLVPCGIVSNNVFDLNVSVAPVSTKSLACIPCILIVMYKLDSSNDDPMPIDPLGLQNG